MDKKNKPLEEYYKYVGSDSQKARKEIEQLNFKKNAYLLSCIALTYKDEGKFFKNGRGRKKIKLDKIEEAKKYIDRAFEINPNCRDVLFTKGEIYNALGETITAIDCYIKILELEEDLSSVSNCSNSDLPFVQMLFNDAKFQLYRLFYDLEDFEMSNKFLEAYKENLEKGINTIYSPLENFVMAPEHI